MDFRVLFTQLLDERHHVVMAELKEIKDELRETNLLVQAHDRDIAKIKAVGATSVTVFGALLSWLGFTRGGH